MPELEENSAFKPKLTTAPFKNTGGGRGVQKLLFSELTLYGQE